MYKFVATALLAFVATGAATAQQNPDQPAQAKVRKPGRQRESSLSRCLPPKVTLGDIVSTKVVGYTKPENVVRTTVEQTLGGLRAICKNDKLKDASGKEIRGSRYVVSNSAIGWTNDLPGNNLWPNTPGGMLQLVAVMSESWHRLTAQGQADAQQKIGIKGTWGVTNADTSFSGLSGTQDRQYASNGFGLKRWTYQ